MSLNAPQVGSYEPRNSDRRPNWYWMSPGIATASGLRLSTSAAVTACWQLSGPFGFPVGGTTASPGLQATSPAAASLTRAERSDEPPPPPFPPPSSPSASAAALNTAAAIPSNVTNRRVPPVISTSLARHCRTLLKLEACPGRLGVDPKAEL